jgi:hypothetical protein
MGVIVEEFERLREDCMRPGGGGFVKQGQVGLAHGREDHGLDWGFCKSNLAKPQAAKGCL